MRSLLPACSFAILGLVAVADDRETRFETRIRPLLARHCVECHGPSEPKAGVRLDTREGAFATRGDDTPLIVPGKPGDSRLMQVVRYDEFDVRMPPKRKLANEEIASLEHWIRDGAFWPETATVQRIPPTDPAEIERLRTEHWAFRPVTRPEPPAGDRSPIDRFVDHRLAEVPLVPYAAADRRTLIRRLSFDLHGLPPTFEEARAFVNDDSPGAYERLVDRMLASPRFGERWARHWLDVARYADTRGYVFTEDKRYPYAYTYRDYVIRAFNEDKPFDRFVKEQLAADQLDLGDDPGAIAALGFLTVGRRFMNREQEIIDDRIDVVTRGFLGLTVACARCHDHKYDPLPTADYYSLYGVFDSTHEPKELPLLEVPTDSPEYQAFKAELDTRLAEHDGYVNEQVAAMRARLRTRAGDYLIELVKRSGRAPEEFYVALDKRDTRPRIVGRWQRYIARRLKADDPVFGPMFHLTKLPGDRFERAAGEWLRDSGNDERFNRVVVDAVLEAKPKSLYDVATAYGNALAKADEAWRAESKRRSDAANAGGSIDVDVPLADAGLEQLRQVLYGDDGPLELSREEVRREFDRNIRDRDKALQRKVDEWRASADGAPPRAMVLRDDDRPTEPAVFIRGNIGRRGERVPRRFPRILAGANPPPFTRGSGRLDLAEAIADPANPLTARVYVNRVWARLLGRGLVATPSEFGLRSDPPTHPQLLDWLAAEFVANGWSTKRLIRGIVTSETYRRSSAPHPEAARVDPDNRLLARARRKRLDFEAGRDAVLAVAGRLDTSITAGRPVDITHPNVTRRTIFGTVDRNNLPTLHRTFDFASPDTSTATRPETTVPQQALFGLNSPFVLDNAGALAGRVAGESSAEERVRALYRFALSREPTDAERTAAVRFLAAHPVSGTERLAHVLLLTNEFAFVD